MKRIEWRIFTRSVLVLCTLSMFMLGCRKGENDPMLSLLSRKARLVGDWSVDSYEKVSVEREDNKTTTFEEFYNGEELITVTTVEKEGATVVEDNADEMLIDPYSVSINRDGTWNATFVKQTTSEVYLAGDTIIIIERLTREIDGIWAFLGKSKEYYKNKERVQLEVLNLVETTKIEGGDSETITSTYLPGENSQVYAIDRLSNKELVMEINEDSEVTYTNVDGETGSTGTYDGGATSLFGRWVFVQ